MTDTNIHGGADLHSLPTDGAPIYMPGGATWLFVRDDSPPGNGLPGPADYEYGPGAGVQLANGPDTLSFSCDLGLVDSISWDATWPWAPGYTMQLDPIAEDAAANDSEANWCVALAADTYGLGDHGTPGGANKDCPDPEICNNNVDDDGDGFADCLDDECFGQAYCCDDDLDGFIDPLGTCGGADCARDRSSPSTPRWRPTSPSPRPWS